MREEQFYLPAVGYLPARFFDESEVVFDALERSGELARLKQLPQLGIIQREWDSANHSRWAYMVLMLTLISRSFDIPSVRLGSRVRLPGQSDVSSARELLRCWILLSNTGHLWWTFTAERALLEQLNEQTTSAVAARATLLRSAQGLGAPVENWAQDILTRNRYYRLYQLIALHRLPRVLSGLTRDELATHRRALVALFVDDYATSLQMRRARATFRRIRRIAFLALDAEYTPSALHISLSRILNDLATLERLLTADDDATDELSSLDGYLTSNVYLGERVLQHVASVQRPLRDRIGRALDGHGLAYTLAEMLNPSWFASIAGARVEPVVRLRWDATNSTALPPALGDPVQVASTLQQEGAVLRLATQTVCETNPGSSVVILQTHASPGSIRGRAAALYLSMQWFQRALAHTHTQMPTIGDIPISFINNARAGAGHGRQLLTAALATFFDSRYVWEWDRESFLWFTLAGSRDELSECFDFIPRFRNYTPTRRHEIASVQHALQHVPSDFYIAGLANLRAFLPDERTPTAELDGVALTIDRRRRALRLTVTEAKLQRAGGAADCRRDLDEKVRLLGVSQGVSRGSSSDHRDGRRASAWTHLRLSYAR